MGHWFRRKRATVMGIVLSGGAVGGIVFPILLQHLIPIIGFAWSTRVIGFIIMACFIVSCLTIRTRLPLSGSISWRTAVDLHGFKDTRYVLATISGFMSVISRVIAWLLTSMTGYSMHCSSHISTFKYMPTSAASHLISQTTSLPSSTQ